MVNIQPILDKEGVVTLEDLKEILEEQYDDFIYTYRSASCEGCAECCLKGCPGLDLDHSMCKVHDAKSVICWISFCNKFRGLGKWIRVEFIILGKMLTNHANLLCPEDVALRALNKREA